MNFANIIAAAKSQTIILDRLNNHLQSSRASGEVKEKRDIDHWHPSSITGCPRAMVFTKLGVEKEGIIEGRIQRIFDTGHHFGYMMQEYFYDMGILYGSWKCRECKHEWDNFTDKVTKKVSKTSVETLLETQEPSPDICPFCGKELRIWRNLDYLEVPLKRDTFLGHADAIIRPKDEFYLVELKTIKNRDSQTSPNAITYDDLNAPKHEHLTQLQMYIWMFQEKAESIGIELDKGLVIYTAKNTQDLKEFPIRLNIDTFIAPILRKVEEIEKSYERGLLPNRPIDAKNKSCATCKYCDFKTICHSLKDNLITSVKGAQV